MWLGILIIGFSVVSAALDDPDLKVSTNGIHGELMGTSGGANNFGGMRPSSSKRMHSAAPGISMMSLDAPEMDMADNMAMPSSGPEPVAQSKMSNERFARSSRMHVGSMGSSSVSSGAQSLGVSFIEDAPSASFDPTSVQTMLVRTGSVDISTDKVVSNLLKNYTHHIWHYIKSRNSCIYDASQSYFCRLYRISTI